MSNMAPSPYFDLQSEPQSLVWSLPRCEDYLLSPSVKGVLSKLKVNPYKYSTCFQAHRPMCCSPIQRNLHPFCLEYCCLKVHHCVWVTFCNTGCKLLPVLLRSYFKCDEAKTSHNALGLVKLPSKEFPSCYPWGCTLSTACSGRYLPHTAQRDSLAAPTGGFPSPAGRWLPFPCRHFSWIREEWTFPLSPPPKERRQGKPRAGCPRRPGRGYGI